ncbi:PAS domain S-box protein [Thermoleptolyngbya oregonensis NK1-22]|uniref:histidine kinase n=1 Tax=Thermoleptolyngbya oregonensis NK1-22 TaxID=2547457 RepID=A0AA96Y7Z7_9CYAN|nr:PAS domain S-box protein [Thermoleptolyngbya oregonensis]WOB44434.1 PAS domain S-box protein [Thermoleptolyngbya oregonensis NK1-22]
MTSQPSESQGFQSSQPVALSSQSLNKPLKPAQSDPCKTSLDLERKLSLLIDRSPMAVIEWNSQLQVMSWNASAERIFGFSAEEVLGRNANQFILPASQFDLVNEIVMQILKQKNGTHSINENQTKDGRTITCEWFNTPLVNSNDEVIGIISMVSDVSDRRQTEQRLQDSERFLDSVINGNPDLMVVKDEQFRFVLVNEALCQQLGRDRSELIGKTDYDLFPAAEADQLRRIDEHVLATGEEYVVEHSAKLADGETHYFMDRKTRFQDAKGRYFIIVTVRDITERRLAELALEQAKAELEERVETRTAELKEQEQFLRSIYNGTDQGIFVVDVDPEGAFRVVDCNTTLTRITGIPQHAFRNKTLAEIFDPVQAESFQKNYERCVRAGISISYEERIRYPDGDIQWFDTTLSPIRNSEGQIYRIIGTTINITDRRNAEDALTASENRYRLLVETSQDLIWSCDRKGCFSFVNAAARTILGYEPQEMLGRPFSDFLAPGQLERDREIFRRVLSGTSVLNHESAYLTKDGQRVMLLFSAAVLRDDQGNVLGSTGTARDITREKQMQQERSRLIEILEASPDLIGTTAPNGTSLYMNRAGRLLAGIPLDASLADYSITNFHPAWATERILQEGIPAAVEQGAWIGETAVLTHEGEEIPVSQLIIAHKNAEGQVDYLSTVMRDIREFRQAEAALRESEERFRLVAEQTGQIIYDYNIITGQIHWAGAIAQMTGNTPEEFQQVDVKAWEQRIHPSDRQRTAKILEKAINERSQCHVEYRFAQADGSYIFVEDHGALLQNEAGEVYRLVGIMNDITERKQAQLELERSEATLRQRSEELQNALQQLQRTQSQMIQAEKMSSLGQLVAGVAHEINNPVNFIYGNLSHASGYTQDLLGLLSLYQKHYPVPHPEIQDEAEAIDLPFVLEDLPKLISSIRVGAERIQKIVASLRTFSRMDEAEFKSVDIHDGIDSTLMILQNRLKGKSDRPEIRILKEYGNLPHVECYAGQLNQVFMNILSNAIDALEEAMAQPNSPFQDKKRQPSIKIRTDLLNGQWVFIRISDNGPGIPEAIRQRLFDPFFTTKSVGKGTGMGLSISYQIVTERHSGTLECHSEPGNGAEFVVKIPLKQMKSVESGDSRSNSYGNRPSSEQSSS